MDNEKMETLSVEIERDLKTKSDRNTSRQMYVQVKRRRVKRQYRRNQDAINFLRRFTLAVVVIDLILSISESSLISTFFLFTTLSTTFDVKPENVIDTYCYYYYQISRSSMCEEYMERVTGYTPSSPSMNRHHHSTTNSPPENHFPTVPSRPPLTLLESRKLFLSYNQSLYDYPVQFSMTQKIEKDSKLSKLYSRLIYLLFENNYGILIDNKSFIEFLKNESSLDAIESAIKSNFSEAVPNLEDLPLQSVISNRLKQSIEVVPPFASDINRENNLLFRLCSKTLNRLKAAQRIKQRRAKEENNNKQPSSLHAPQYSLVNPFRKNLIQATEFIRHRWKRDIPIALNDSYTVENKVTGTPSGNFENGHVQKTVKDGETTRTPIATGSNTPVEDKKRTTATAAYDDDDTVEKEKQEGSSGSVTSRTKHSRGNGFRLIKNHNSSNNMKQVSQGMEDDNFYDTAKSITSRKDSSNFAGHTENLSITDQSKEHNERNVQMILTTAEGNLNNLILNKSQVKANKNNEREQHRKNRNDEEKYLEELSLGLSRSPRPILSLMEVALFNEWQRFEEISKRLSVNYKIDDSDMSKEEKDEPLVWLSVRQKIIENVLLNMETNIFSPETFKKAERRKRAMEQIYHDYSFTILGELKNVKEMTISRSFEGVFWAIKLYLIIWQVTICMVLFFGSVFEDKTALNIWGIFSILTSLLHFMIDDWINTSFQPEKTSASIWFGVVYGVYKPITILLVATLSSEIYKQDGGKKKCMLTRIREIIKGRTRPTLIAERCLKKLKGLFITPDGIRGNGRASNGVKGSNGTSTENNNGNLIYKGIKAVKIKAKIKRMVIDNGSLIVVAQTALPCEADQRQTCVICGSQTAPSYNDNEERIHEGHFSYPSAPQDNEAGMTAEDLYPEETEEEDEDELEEVVDEDEDELLEEVADEEEDESDEEDEEDNEECSHPDHDRKSKESQRLCGVSTSRDKNDAAELKEKKLADKAVLSEVSKSVTGTDKINGQVGLSLISYAGNGIQGNLINDSSTQATCHGQGEELLHGPIVDGGNLYI